MRWAHHHFRLQNIAKHKLPGRRNVPGFSSTSPQLSGRQVSSQVAEADRTSRRGTNWGVERWFRIFGACDGANWITLRSEIFHEGRHERPSVFAEDPCADVQGKRLSSLGS